MRGEIGRCFVFSCSDGKYLMTTVPYGGKQGYLYDDGFPDYISPISVLTK
jgi:hypothetical protein